MAMIIEPGLSIAHYYILGFLNQTIFPFGYASAHSIQDR